MFGKGEDDMASLSLLEVVEMKSWIDEILVDCPSVVAGVEMKVCNFVEGDRLEIFNF